MPAPLPLTAPPLPLFERLREWGSFRPGTRAVAAVLERLGNPHHTFRHAAVGGTNGKGTVASNLARHVPGTPGLFLSPHLVDLRERIQVRGEPAVDGEWHEAHAAVLAAVPEPELSYFEWLLVLAVLIFARREVGFAVFEVGVGGRRDAVNALDPELSVVTSVSLDHRDLLGDTVEEVAVEKVGIGRRGRPLVLPRSVLDLSGVRSAIETIGCRPVPFADAGGFEDNRAALAAARGCLGLGDGVEEPLRLEMLPGRRQVLDLGRGVWVDGAHNETAWKDLAGWLGDRGAGPFTVLCSLSAGRDPETFCAALAPVARRFVHWQAGFERELPASSWPAAVERIRAAELPSLLDEPLLVTGSLYLVGRFELWRRTWRPCDGE